MLRRAVFALLAITSTLVVALGASTPALAAGCPVAAPTAAGFGAAIDRIRSSRWTAADLTGSIDLTDGRRLWLYGDTITSGLTPTGGTVTSGFTARNSAIVQDRGCLTPLINGAGATASSWIPPLGDQWNWPGDGFARGGTIWIYATRLLQTSPDIFGFRAQAVDLVEVDQATLSIRQVHRNRYGAAPVLLGSSVTTDGTWTYLYGRDELGSKRNTYVARVAAANPLGATSYWTGATWSTSAASARPIFTTEVVGGPAFHDLGPAYGAQRYVAAVKDGEFMTGDIELYHAPGPAGPWSKAMTTVVVPLASEPSSFTYLASLHGIDAATGGLHLTWNINSFDVTSPTRDVHAYTQVHRALPLNLRVPAGAPAVPTAVPVGALAGYAPIVPTRILDTRNGLGGLTRLAPEVTYAVAVTGRAGIPSGATGVVATFTAVNPWGAGYLTVWPCGAPRPNASSLNFRGYDIVPNTIMAALAANGTVCVVSSSAVDLLVDASGWMAPGGAGFGGVAPTRLLDTRTGTRVPAGVVAPVRVVGRAGVPAGAKAAALNITAVDATDHGYVTAWPCDRPLPEASVVNVVPGVNRADNAVVPLSAAGDVCLLASAPMHLVVDVNGWFGAGGWPVQAVVPVRRLDTRSGQGGAGRPGAGQILTLDVAGRYGIPAGATAVRVNLAAVGPGGGTFVTAYPCSRYPPTISNLNTEAATPALANGAMVPLGPRGQLCLYVSTATDVLVDVEAFV